MTYKNCFDHEDGKIHNYRPLFWYASADEAAYDATFSTTHSDCYTVWGMSRTGCVGCPYNRKIGDEIEIIQYYEPKKAKAAKYIFRDSYEYTRQYREFAAKMNAKEKQIKGQISILDFKEITDDAKRD